MLDDIGLSYEEINIEEQELTREDLVNLTGGFTVPQIIINDKPIGGFDKLLQLNQSGKLKELLANS
jgi:glutaredoxin